MKKLLAFLLVLVMILSVSLVACNKQQAASDNDDDDDWGNGNEVTDDENKDNNLNIDDTVDTPPVTQGWVQKDDKVYVGAESVNLRREASAGAAWYCSVSIGTELHRLRTNGTYDEISYEGETLYVRSDLVTSNKKDLDFSNTLTTPVEITFKGNFNLRSDPVVYSNNALGESNVVFTYDTKQAAKITGTFTKVAVSANGVWYKLSFTGTAYGTYYADKVLYVKVIIGGQSYTNYINDPSVTTGGQGGLG